MALRKILIGATRTRCCITGGFVRLMATYYSRVTRKGQATIPSAFRKKLGIEEGDRVVFEEAEQGLILKPAADVEDSAGAMSSFGDAEEVLGKLLRDRKKSFR